MDYMYEEEVVHNALISVENVIKYTKYFIMQLNVFIVS